MEIAENARIFQNCNSENLRLIKETQAENLLITGLTLPIQDITEETKNLGSNVSDIEENETKIKLMFRIRAQIIKVNKIAYPSHALNEN